MNGKIHYATSLMITMIEKSSFMSVATIDELLKRYFILEEFYNIIYII